MEPNRHGVETEPFKSYMVTTEDNETPVYATRTRNVWNSRYGGFVAYNQFVASAVLLPDDAAKVAHRALTGE